MEEKEKSDSCSIWKVTLPALITGLLAFAGTYYTVKNDKNKVLIANKTENLINLLKEKKEIEISFSKHIYDQKCYNEYPKMREEAKSLADRNKEIDALIEEINKLSK